jgi:hypothetical protein
MVTLDEWRQVQERCFGGETSRHRKSAHDFPYTGLIKCGTCGKWVTAELQRGRLGRGNWVYYHCNNKSGVCGKKSVREDVLESRIDACLGQITITPELQEIVRDALEKWIVREFASLETVYQEQMRAAADSERMLSELFEMRLKSLIDDDMFRTKQQELKDRISDLRLRISTSQERLDRTRSVVESALEFRLHAREQFLIGDTAKRREIAQALGVRYVLERGEIFIEMNPLLQPLPAPRAQRIEQRIEPQETGSETQIKHLSSERVLAGTPASTLIEPYAALFWAVWEGTLTFPIGSR